MSARHRHAKETGRALMQLKSEWGNAKRLPQSLFHWLYLWCREKRLAARRKLRTLNTGAVE